MRRSAALRGLSDDHHRALVLARRARTASSGDEIDTLWRAIAHEWETGLERHFAVEETHLLPPVRAAGGEALAARVEQDHAALRSWILSGPFDAVGLRQLGERLSDHVRFEERELFPFAEAKLTPADLERIAGAYS